MGEIGWVTWGLQTLLLGFAAGSTRLIWLIHTKINMQDQRLAMVEQKLVEHTNQISEMRAQMANQISEIRSQMVGWDVLKRMELTLSQIAKGGQGNEAMGAMAAVIQTEIAARRNNNY